MLDTAEHDVFRTELVVSAQWTASLWRREPPDSLQSHADERGNVMSDGMEKSARRHVVGRKRDGRSVSDEAAKAELAACGKPGASVSRLARECGDNANQLSHWARERSQRLQRSSTPPAASAAFAAVQTEAALSTMDDAGGECGRGGDRAVEPAGPSARAASRTRTGSTLAASAPYFQHKMPCDPSRLVRRRQHIGGDGCEWLLEHSIKAALSVGVMKSPSLNTVIVDTAA